MNFYFTVVNIGIMNSLYDPEAIGQTYEAVGPERITMVRINYKLYSETQHKLWNRNFKWI